GLNLVIGRTEQLRIDSHHEFHGHQLAKVGFEPSVIANDLGVAVEQLEQLHGGLDLVNSDGETDHDHKAAHRNDSIVPHHEVAYAVPKIGHGSGERRFFEVLRPASGRPHMQR